MEITASKLSKYWESLTEQEKSYYKRNVTDIEHARDQREQPCKEFDNLTYTQRYELQREADLSYNDLKGDNDSRDKNYSLTTGITRHKDTTVLSHLASMEFEADIEPYDEENNIQLELGETAEDLVKKSRELEGYTNKRLSIYRELIAQGDVFVEEQYIEQQSFNKDCKTDAGSDWTPGMKVSQFKFDDKPIVTVYDSCEVKLIPGKYVFLYNLTEQDIKKQSGVATYAEMSFAEAETIYGNWDRWDYVKESLSTQGCKDKVSEIFNTGITTQDPGFGIWGADYFWSIQKPGKGNVGIVKLYKQFTNEFMIFINGIMMLPIGFPLTKISPSAKVPIAKGSAEVIQNFSYSKGIPSNSYVDEKIFTYTYEALMKKLMQSAEPTLTNRTGKVLPRNFMQPSKVHTGLRANDLEPLLPPETRTITNSDTAFFGIVREILNTKTVEDAFSGGSEGSGTATEFLEQKKNTIGKLFQVIAGVKNLEEDLAKLRIANIITHWTKAKEEAKYEETLELVEGVMTVTGKKLIPGKTSKKYRTETVKTKLKQENKQGIRVVRFHGVDDLLPSPREQQREEDKMEKEYKSPVRISYLNAQEFLKTLYWHWKINIIPRSTDGSKLELLTYLDNKQRIANLFGIDAIQRDYTLQRVATMNDEEYDKAYVPSSQQAQLQQMQSDLGKKGTERNPLESVLNANKPSLGKEAKMI